MPAPLDLWEALRAEAELVSAREHVLCEFLETSVLERTGLISALSRVLARKLDHDSVPAQRLEQVVQEAMLEDRAIAEAVVADLIAVRTRDPAAAGFLTPFLYYKGFHALEWHRVGHWLWQCDRQELALFLQSQVSERLALDIHPAVPIGRGVFIDHATGIVIGETAVVGNDVSILHDVTLGGIGKDQGDRHPKIRDGVLLCAGAKILGNVEIGSCAKIGAGSVVLADVPENATAVGVPARVVGWGDGTPPSLDMDQSIPE